MCASCFQRWFLLGPSLRESGQIRHFICSRKTLPEVKRDGSEGKNLCGDADISVWEKSPCSAASWTLFSAEVCLKSASTGGVSSSPVLCCLACQRWMRLRAASHLICTLNLTDRGIQKMFLLQLDPYGKRCDQKARRQSLYSF